MAGFEEIIAGLGNQIKAFTAGSPTRVGGFNPTPGASGGFAPGGVSAGGFSPGQGPQGGQWRVGGGEAPGFAVGGRPGRGFLPGGISGGGFGVGGISGGFSPGPVPAKGFDPNAPIAGDGGGGVAGSPSTGMSAGVAQWADLTTQTFADLGQDLPDVMLAIMTHESGGKADAFNPAGPAYGLFQLMNAGNLPVDEQFRRAKALLQQKLTSIEDSYRANGLSPDQRTRARDIALAWAGHFDYRTGLPNGSSRDQGSGQTAAQLSEIFLANYDKIKAGRSQGGVPSGGGSGDLAAIGTPWARKAQQLLGVAYTHGGIRNTGNPLDGMDCSSFAGYILGLDRNIWNAQAQYDATGRVTAQQAQAGDLVFFQGTTSGDPSARPVTHVGVYIGGGKMVHTGGSGGVMVVDLNTPYWQSHLYGFGRVRAGGGGPK
jgi:cell wall-associated NlpC family hydrolase